MAFYITRPINGISLNGVEYVRDENDEPIIFENMGKAKEFLAKHGYCETDIENEGIDFEEVDPVTPKSVTEPFRSAVNEETLRQLKEEYPAGSNIVLLKMDDIQAPPIGTIGKVKGVDSAGSILVSWKNNGSLNVAYGEDIAKKITLDSFAEPNPIHNVMLTLARKLSEANIPYELEPVKDGWRINCVMTDSVLRFVRYSGFNGSKDSLNDNQVYMFSIMSKEQSDTRYDKYIISAEDAFFVIYNSWNGSQSDGE